MWPTFQVLTYQCRMGTVSSILCSELHQPINLACSAWILCPPFPQQLPS